jgi:NAD(P)-dependent dehydrogenase (short-subunit alcohol dehydrogenase family)
VETAPTQAPSSYDQIGPVLIGQGMFEEVMAKDKADKPEVMARQNKLLADRYNTKSKRFETPEEAAAMMVYVCSPRASATNGSALRVDGGVVRSIV